jgi:D-apionolactonase
MILYGTDERPAPMRVLRAGAISAALDQGNLRYIQCGDVEIIRAISFIVRDTAWGTYTPLIDDLRIDEGPDACQVTYRAVCAGPEGTFCYTAGIEITAKGGITFSAEGEAEADFPTNRAGFVILHPIEGVAGAPVEVLHTDGRIEQARFPELIEPWQPIFDIRALTHWPRPGLRVSCRMEGDAFETEDHRNWGDASYKTYIRPLAKGYPYVLPAGERIAQSVMVTVSGATLDDVSARSSAEPVRLTIGSVAGVCPGIGLAVDADDSEAALARKDALAATGVRSLLIRFDARRHGAEEARCAEALRRVLDAEAVLEVVIPGGDPHGELAAVAATLIEGGLQPAALVASPARDLKSRPSGLVEGEATLPEIAAAARAIFSGARIGGGTFAYFTEFNRNPPPATGLDFVTHSFAANIHAADDLSVMETLETVPHMARTLRERFGSIPHHVGFATIAMREAPYGPGPVPNPRGGRVAASRVDPRQRSLFGAAWALGFAARAAQEGIAAIGFAMPTGPFGIVSDEAEDKVFPIYTVLRGLASVAERRRREVTISHPGEVQAVACEDEDGVELWIANLTANPVDVDIDGFEPTSLRLLDESSCPASLVNPGGIDATVRSFSQRRIALAPYAVAFLAGMRLG